MEKCVFLSLSGGEGRENVMDANKIEGGSCHPRLSFSYLWGAGK